MGRQRGVATALVILLLASAAAPRRRSLRGMVANAATQAIDADAVLEAIDIEALVERIDINELVSRVDIEQLMDRIDVNELVGRIDVDELVSKLDIDQLIARVDIDQLVGRIDMDRLVQAIDIDAAVGQVDMDSLLSRVDMNQLLDRIDPDLLLDRVDPNRLLDRVDPNQLLDRVDPDRLLDRVDPNRLLERVDVNALADRVDVDRIMDRVDVVSLVNRAGIPQIVQESTGHMAGSVLDVARRQVVAIDQITERVAGKVIGHGSEDAINKPPLLQVSQITVGESGKANVTGHYAGPLSRLLAFAADVAIIFFAFTLTSSVVLFLGDQLLGWSMKSNLTDTYIGFALLVLWAFSYIAGSLIIAGRTIGKGIVGLRVVRRSGAPLQAGQAVIRVVVTPVALFTWLFSYIGLFFGRERRALTDVIAGTVVVYDWGDRPAEMSAPLTRWLIGNEAATVFPAEAPDSGATPIN
ncbi:MAG: RDD family protein [Actinomycetes bacterium]